MFYRDNFVLILGASDSGERVDFGLRDLWDSSRSILINMIVVLNSIFDLHLKDSPREKYLWCAFDEVFITFLKLFEVFTRRCYAHFHRTIYCAY